MNSTKTIFQMMIENTGSHLLDSGGAYGRHWEKNQDKTLEYFQKQPDVITNIDSYTNSDGKKVFSYEYTISTFHWLDSWLSTDDLCIEFNKKPVDDWESDIHGVSKDGANWLKNKGLEPGSGFNTYNGDSNLSQVVQGTWLHDDDVRYNNYILIQIHGGCDVRGGYTDAKLFTIDEEYRSERVFGTFNGENVSNCYDGYSITYDDNNEEIQPTSENDKLELWLSEV